MPRLPYSTSTPEWATHLIRSGVVGERGIFRGSCREHRLYTWPLADHAVSRLEWFFRRFSTRARNYRYELVGLKFLKR